MIRPFLSITVLLGCMSVAPLMAETDLEELNLQLLEQASNPESDFDTAISDAAEAGLAQGKLFQARLIHAMNTQDYDTLLNMAESIPQYADDFDVGFDPNGEGQYTFSSPHEVMGLYHTLVAVIAYQQGDEAAFETHYKEAAWEWPAWEQVFQLSSLVLQERSAEMMDQYVAGLTLPMDLPLRDLDGEPTTLGALMEGKKAVLMDFWASWCGPCMALMPELQNKSDLFGPQGVFVVGVNTDDSDPLTKAAQVKDQKEMDMPWLVEAEGQPLSKLLNITSIPRMVLVSPEGKILYNDHPADPRLYEVLAELGVGGHAE